MKFVNEDLRDEIKGLTEAATKEIARQDKQDQLGIEETKPVEEPKQQINLNKKDMVTMTLVNMRKTPSKTAEVVMTIKGGETVSADTISSNGFTKVKYKNKEGYIAHKYLR